MPQTNYMKRTISLVFLATLLSEAAAYVALPSFMKSKSVSLARLSAMNDEKPLFSVPIPGSRTATLQIPGPKQAQALAAQFAEEASKIGPAAAAARVITATQAVATVARYAATGTFAEVMIGGGGAGALLGNTASSGKPLAPRLLRELFEQLGPVYVKLGQLVASSPSVFPAEYVEEFQACLDKSSTVPFSDVQRVVAADLGAPLSSLYRRFEVNPLACGSVAQVHGATLWDGTDVVVKVLKPKVREALTADLAFLTIAAQALEAVAPEASRLSTADVALDLRDSMLGELDFEAEASRMRTFQAFLDANQLGDRVTCPLPVRSLTSSSVLTMTRLRGRPLVQTSSTSTSSSSALNSVQGDSSSSSTNNKDEAAAEAAAADALTLENAAVVALAAWSQSVAECEFFHADVHGGNLLLLDDGRVAFLDWGIVGTLPPSVWASAGSMREGFAQGDMKAVAQSLVTMGVAAGGEDGKVDLDGLAEDLGKVLGSMRGGSTGKSKVGDASGVVGSSTSTSRSDASASPASSSSSTSSSSPPSLGGGVGLVSDVIAAAERHGLRLPKAFGLLAKQALYFDRYLQALAPGVDPFTDPRVSLFGGATSSGGSHQDVPPASSPPVETSVEEISNSGSASKP